MQKDYYKILGVNKNASDDEIRKAYRQMSHRFHPDKQCNNSNTSKFIEANEAYSVLKDKTTKQKYDRMMESNEVPVNYVSQTESSYNFRDHSIEVDIFNEIDQYFSAFFQRHFRDFFTETPKQTSSNHIHYDDMVK